MVYIGKFHWEACQNCEHFSSEKEHCGRRKWRTALTYSEKAEGIICNHFKRLKRPKGKVLKKGYRIRGCPVHKNPITKLPIYGKETNWKPEDRLDQRLVEFRCKKGHAFYLTITD